MPYRSRLSWLGLSVAGLVIAQAVVRAQTKDTETNRFNLERLTAEVAAPDQTGAPALPDTEVAGKLSEYWIGVMFAPISGFPLAQSQLALKHGMVVLEVIDDAPAAKAGLRQHDIVLKFAGQEAARRDDLIDRIAERKDQPVEVVLLRGGQELTLTITPQKRPDFTAQEAASKSFAEARRRADELTQHEDLFLTMPEVIDHDGWRALRMLQLRPGFLIEDPAAGTAGAFPDDLSVMIKKHGAKPAEIVVEKGDQRWQVTEDHLSDLPEEVRPWVEQYLSRRLFQGATLFGTQTPWTVNSAEVSGNPPEAAEAPEGLDEERRHAEAAHTLDAYRLLLRDPNSVERRLDRVLEELQELRQQVEDLKSQSR